MVYPQILGHVGDSVVQKCSLVIHVSKIIVYIDSFFVSYFGALHEGLPSDSFVKSSKVVIITN